MAFHFEKPVFETLITSAATVSDRKEYENQGRSTILVNNNDDALWCDRSPYGIYLIKAFQLNRMPYEMNAGLARNCDNK